jgi:hypothetical protein
MLKWLSRELVEVIYRKVEPIHANNLDLEVL